MINSRGYSDSPIINTASGVGTLKDPSTYNHVGASIDRPIQELDLYFENSWACRRVAELPPSLMCREWGVLTEASPEYDEETQKLIKKIVKYVKTIPGLSREEAIAFEKLLGNQLGIKSDKQEKIVSEHDRLKVIQNFEDAQTFANVHGVAYIVIDFEGEELSDPIDPKKISKISRLFVLERWQMRPMGYLPTDKIDPEFYELVLTNNQIILTTEQKVTKIHSTRVLRFKGTKLSQRRVAQRSGAWGSVLEPFINVWTRFFNAHAGLSRALAKSDLLVHYIDGYFDKLITGGKNYADPVHELERQNQLMWGLYNNYVDDKNNKWERLSADLADMPQSITILKDELIAASGLPGSLLYSEHSSGLDASGKTTGEMTALNDWVKSLQIAKFSDNIEILNNYLLVYLGVRNLENYHWEWSSLFSLNAQQKAEIFKTYAEADSINIESGVYSNLSARTRHEGTTFRETLTLVDDPNEDLLQTEQLPVKQVAQLEPTPEESINEDADGIRLANLEKKGSRFKYRGMFYTLNKPYKIQRTNDNYKVLATKNGYAQLVRFNPDDVDTTNTYSDSYHPSYWANLFFNFEKPPQQIQVYSSDFEDDYLYDGRDLELLEKKDGKVYYNGSWWEVNKPKKATQNGKKYQVLAKKKVNGKMQVKLVSFGDADMEDYTQHKDPQRRLNYLKRSAGIRNSQGELTKNDPWSANYWSRKFLWNADELLEDDATPAKKIIEWNGLKIGLQYFPFDTRHGRTLTTAYGHFRNTKGADGMAVDVYVGTNLDLDNIFVIEQLIDGKFDEHKYIIGVATVEEAKQLYIQNMPEEMLGNIRETTISELRSFLKDSDEKLAFKGTILKIPSAESIASDLENNIDEIVGNWEAIAPDGYKNLLGE